MKVKVSYLNSSLQKTGGYTKNIKKIEELCKELYKSDIVKLKKNGYVLTDNPKNGTCHLAVYQIL